MASRSWNRVELIGNLTRDPELRYTPQGTAVVSFSIATNRTYLSEGERKEEADFHRIVAWSKLAELCSQLLKKGNRVFVSGRLQTRNWAGQDGASRQTTEIVIEDMILLTARNGSVDATEDITEEAVASKATAKPAPIKPALQEAEEKGVLPTEPTETKKETEEAAVDKLDEDLPF